MTDAFELPPTARVDVEHCELLGDWYSLRVECSWPGASVEGTAEHMRSLAASLRARTSFSERRCAVGWSGGRAYLCSPRNSTNDGVGISEAQAQALADTIDAVLSQEGEP